MPTKHEMDTAARLALAKMLLEQGYGIDEAALRAGLTRDQLEQGLCKQT